MNGFSYAPAKLRLAAKAIDLAIILFLGFALREGLGSVLGFLYSLVADALPFGSWSGQSVGKRVFRIRVISQREQSALKASVLRNIPVGLVTFLMIIPFWGWILSFVVGIPLGAFEISLMLRAAKHQRLGDTMAETVVVKNA